MANKWEKIKCNLIENTLKTCNIEGYTPHFLKMKFKQFMTFLPFSSINLVKIIKINQAGKKKEN